MALGAAGGGWLKTGGVFKSVVMLVPVPLMDRFRLDLDMAFGDVGGGRVKVGPGPEILPEAWPWNCCLFMLPLFACLPEVGGCLFECRRKKTAEGKAVL